MQMDKKRNVRKKENDYMLKVIGVQFLACGFIFALIFGVYRFSPDSGQGIKAKYNEIMKTDISLSQVWSSVREVAEYVMKPVDVESVKDTASANDDTIVDEQEYYENEQENETKVTQTDKNNTVAVMSLFSEESSITAPVKGRITSYFGKREDPISGDDSVHKAIDIAVDEGTNVGAAWDGIVTKTGNDSVSGNYIWMVHKNGCETFYCHLNQVLVSENSVIRAGETIAFSGNTGYSTGPHLHFGVKENGEYVDPLNYLDTDNGEI